MTSFRSHASKRVTRDFSGNTVDIASSLIELSISNAQKVSGWLIRMRLGYEYNYGSNGEFIGLDVKGMRTQRRFSVTAHLKKTVKQSSIWWTKSVAGIVSERKTLVDARGREALEHIKGITQASISTIL